MLGGEGSEEERETGPLTPSEVQRSSKPWSAECQDLQGHGRPKVCPRPLP